MRGLDSALSIRPAPYFLASSTGSPPFGSTTRALSRRLISYGSEAGRCRRKSVFPPASVTALSCEPSTERPTCRGRASR